MALHHHTIRRHLSTGEHSEGIPHLDQRHIHLPLPLLLNQDSRLGLEACQGCQGFSSLPFDPSLTVLAKGHKGDEHGAGIEVEGGGGGGGRGGGTSPSKGAEAVEVGGGSPGGHKEVHTHDTSVD